MSSPQFAPNTLDVGRIRAAGLCRHVDLRDEVASTNTLALETLRRHPLEVPALFLAHQQTAGRGRGANRWWSQPGALTFSLVIDPLTWQLDPSHWPRVSLCTALAVALACDHLLGQSTCQIKWPNDVWLSGFKICGILVEVSPTTTTSSPRIVIGVGLNANNSLASAPDDIRQRATSLVDATARTFDLTGVLLEVVQRIFDQLLRLTREPQSLVTDWQERSALTGRIVTVELGNRQVRGSCLGIDHDGALLLQTPTETARIVGGVVTRID